MSFNKANYFFTLEALVFVLLAGIVGVAMALNMRLTLSLRNQVQLRFSDLDREG